MSTSLQQAHRPSAAPAPRQDLTVPVGRPDLHGGRREPDALRSLVASEALSGVPPHVELGPYLRWFHATYGQALAGVVFYGSCLSAGTRRSTSTPDFFIVTDTGRIPAHSRLTRALHRFVPPSSQTGVVQREEGEDGHLFKYVHLDTGQLADATSPACRDLFVAGRLSKRVRLVYWRDDEARERLLDALCGSVRTLAPIVWSQLPPTFDLDQLVTASVAISYLSEWRVEAAGKIDSLVQSAPDYYRALYAQVLDDHLRAGRVVGLPDGRYRSTARAADARRGRRRLRRSRWRGAVRWPKYALTVRGAAQLMLGKLQRAHPELRVSRFGQRFPLWYALPFLVRLLWRGALRTHAPGSPAVPGPPSEVHPWHRRFALVANLASRRNREGRFDPTPFQLALGARGVVRASSRLEDLPAIVDELQDRGVEAIFVLGGDGTLGSVVTEVLHRWKGPLPAFVPLRGGALNNTAKAVGAGRTALKDVRRLLMGAVTEKLLRPLRVSDPARRDRDTFGFVFGAGLVYEYARSIAARGGSTWWNTATESIALTVAGYLGTRRGREVWRPVPADVSLGAEPLPYVEFMAVSACAVIAQPWLLRPFPEPQPTEAETMPYIVNAMNPRGIIRHTLGILRGRCRGDRHYRGHTGTLRLCSTAGYMLDGELHGSRDEPVEVTVRVGPPVRVWTPSLGAR